VLRPEIVQARLTALSGFLVNLLELARTPREEFLTSWRAGWLAERGLQLSLEAVFDIGNHILVAAFGDQPQDYEDVLRRLERHAVVDPALAKRLRGLGRFRNLLVHRYLDLDPDRVYDHLQAAVVDLPELAAQLAHFIDKR